MIIDENEILRKYNSDTIFIKCDSYQNSNANSTKMAKNRSIKYSVVSLSDVQFFVFLEHFAHARFSGVAIDITTSNSTNDNNSTIIQY